MDGEGKAVQGLSCRRWRCWPSSTESPFLGWIQGVEAVEVGGWPRVGLRRILSAVLGVSVGSTAPANGVGPSSWPGQPPAWCRLDGRGREGRTGVIVEAVEVLAVLPGILFPGLIPGVEAVEVGGLLPAPSNGVGPSSWLPPALLQPGQPPAWRVGSMDGEGKAVQGLSCRRWRCWPSSTESPFLGWIQGVEAVEVGGWPRVGLRRILSAVLGVSVGSTAPANGVGPSSWPGQPPAWCRLDGRGREGRTGVIVEAVEVLAVLPGILFPGLIPGVEAVEVGGLLPAPSNGVGPSSWLPPALLRPRPASGGSCAGCDLNGGGKRTVQGLSWGRWRCWPSVRESPFLGWIQGVEVVEVSADPAAAGLRVGPGGSCRLRVGARLAACRPPADPVGSMGGEGKAVQGLSWGRWRSAGRVGWLPALAPAPSNGVGPSSWLPLALLRPRPASGGSCAGCDLNGGGKRTVQGLSWGRWRLAGRVGWLAPAASHPAGSLRHYYGAASPRRLAGGAGCDLNGGKWKAVQGLLWRRWRCWPSALESSFLARFWAWRRWKSAAGCVSASGGSCRLRWAWRLALAPSNGVGPSSWPGLRHYCGPASLRRQLRWLRPQRRGLDFRLFFFGIGPIIQGIVYAAC